MKQNEPENLHSWLCENIEWVGAFFIYLFWTQLACSSNSNLFLTIKQKFNTNKLQLAFYLNSRGLERLNVVVVEVHEYGNGLANNQRDPNGHVAVIAV
jgi:hypothetical protein